MILVDEPDETDCPDPRGWKFLCEIATSTCKEWKHRCHTLEIESDQNRKERDLARDAAENYWLAWQDASQYWKSKVQRLQEALDAQGKILDERHVSLLDATHERDALITRVKELEADLALAIHNAGQRVLIR